jgi:hypothetical protein
MLLSLLAELFFIAPLSVYLCSFVYFLMAIRLVYSSLFCACLIFSPELSDYVAVKITVLKVINDRSEKYFKVAYIQKTCFHDQFFMVYKVVSEMKLLPPIY